ncbi:macrophage mannose receptor 1 [Xenopus tropicalis]|uniref:Macrophage mannose receptor 1 n=1 Tax=Xenopus tropicalis TaxID=8364 RepID=A0A8J1JAQ3_XENTR|nr:macrophage mannose receptor 1 [Xenopus tropicalis]
MVLPLHLFSDSCISGAMKSIKQDILQTIQKEIRQCDSGWKSFDGSCYYIVTTMKNWTEARGFCKSMNSDLVIIKSAREQKFLENITSITKFWIGLTKDRNKNVWRWVDGTLHNLSDGFWYEDEPNNEAGREDCVNLWKDKKWNDVYCTGLYKAICRKGTRQSDSDSDDYENVPGTKEPREMMRFKQESKGENLSPKALKASETLGTQRRLLMVLVTLLVLVFIFLIILTSLMFIYYSTVSRQLQQEHEEKANLLTQITAINQTLDSRISEAMESIKQDIQTIRKERPQCDSGWKSFDGSCYCIGSTETNWTEAQSICKSMNSDLVIIDSEREQKFLENITDDSYFWIGLTRDNNNMNVWRWVDGTLHDLSDGFWYKNEPNNEDGRENCGHLWKEKKWNDVFCTDLYETICERKWTCCV